MRMTRGLRPLLVAQFLTAFGDNAILFAAIAMVLQGGRAPDGYIPALQAAFLLAYVLLAPWVGPLADRLSKPRVLILGNLVKAAGAGLVLAGAEPLLAYALVGLGAAVYSPAKYGILPEMAGHDELVRANAWIEGSTIAAIILGTFAGGRLADWRIDATLWIIAALYVASMLVTLLIPRLAPRGARLGGALTRFAGVVRQFMHSPRARFAMLGASLFWGASAVLRVLLVAWAPAVLATRSAGDISELVLFLAVGVIAGAAVVPRLIPLEHLRRARLAAYAMGGLILLLGLVDSAWPARLVLFATGVAGGLFVVPVNAALQEIGHARIGAGRAVAIQNFFQNLAMLLAVALYGAAEAGRVPPVGAMLALGGLVLLASLLISRRLPADQNRAR